MVVSIRLLWRPSARRDSLPLPQCAIPLAGRWASHHNMACDGSNCAALLDVGDIRGRLPVCSFKACSRCSTVSGLSQVFDSFNLCRSVPTLRPPSPLLPSAHPLPDPSSARVVLSRRPEAAHPPLEATRHNNARERKEQSGNPVWNQHPTA